MAAREFDHFPWIAPWHAISPAGKEAYEQELYSELSAEHPLHGMQVTAVGRTFRDDDVLFVLHGTPCRLAVVHLTFTGTVESNPRWPTVQFFNDIEDWVAMGMMADAARYERNRRSEAA